MSVIFNEKEMLFHLRTNKTSYIFGFPKDNIPVHLYWGRRLSETPSFNRLFPPEVNGPRAFSAIDAVLPCGKELSRETLPCEFPVFGNSDMRMPLFHAKYKDGSAITDLRYKSHRITDGKPPLEGLPATYAEESDKDVQTLELTMEDDITGLSVILQYSVFENLNAITRSYKCVNNGNDSITVMRALSASLDFKDNEYDMISLNGAWTRERFLTRAPLTEGDMNISSLRGASSHFHNPFFALVSKAADEDKGDAFGFSFVYSGNFLAGASCDYLNMTRAYMGIHPFNFSWLLEKGETLQLPEVVMVYSSGGIGEMSRTYHRLYRNRLCPDSSRNIKRCALINNWEATYFDFNEEKILSIAETASKCGIKLMVLDDGWFGKRDDDTNSLGDWFPDRNKLPDGIDGLCRKINSLGMKFGLWFEPEMISPDSRLYEAHPDWCIHVNNRKPSLSRHQLILDLSRNDVCEYIIKAVNDVLGSADIAYVKWDYNRSISYAGSALSDSRHQGEFYHRYILGLYRVLGAITSAHKNILFESCSGGGGRFDPGMLYYMPQVWTSDNTDALSRLSIQYGTSICYPYCTMGAHVSAVPNSLVGRTTPFAYRGNIALPGQFGYELDLNTLSEDELGQIKKQVDFYETYGNVFHNGDLYRLMNPDNGKITAIEFISEDSRTVIVMIYSMLATSNTGPIYIYPKGLSDSSVYKNKDTGEEWYGDALSSVGIPFMADSDFKSSVLIFEKQD